MKKNLKLLALTVLFFSTIFSYPDGSRKPLLSNKNEIAHPNKPPVTFYWILDNIPGRKATVWPVTAAIAGSMTAPAGWMACCNEPASVAMAAIGTSLLFYSTSCLVAACVVTEKKHS